MARLDFEFAEREISDDLFSREPEDWVQASKREPSKKGWDFFKSIFRNS